MDLAHESLTYNSRRHRYPVSILVLVDLAHESHLTRELSLMSGSFNPCFSGSCSRIRIHFLQEILMQKVSILVLVDLAHESVFIGLSKEA